MINTKKIILIFSLIGIFSCNQSKNQNESIHFSAGSKWTFINKDRKIGENYAEIEFNKNYTLIIYSEIDGKIGPFHYNESDNILTFNNVNFSIVSDKNGSLLLKNNNNEFLSYKIPFDENKLDSNQIDPFYLRRCYFLVNLNYITTDDAILYLSKISKDLQDLIPKEEIIFSNYK